MLLTGNAAHRRDRADAFHSAGRYHEHEEDYIVSRARGSMRSTEISNSCGRLPYRTLAANLHDLPGKDWQALRAFG